MRITSHQSSTTNSFGWLRESYHQMGYTSGWWSVTPSVACHSFGARGWVAEFNLGSIPVRIEFPFVLVAVLTGARAGSVPLLLAWVIVLFVSILVHELGHALLGRPTVARCASCRTA